MQQFAYQYQTLSQLLDSDALEPNYTRQDWQQHQGPFNQAFAEYGQLHQRLTSIAQQQGDVAAQPMRHQLMQAAGKLAAVVAATGNPDGAQNFLREQLANAARTPATAELQAAQRDLNSFVALSHGRWLMNRGRHDQVAGVVNPVMTHSQESALKMAAQQLLGGQAAPPMQQPPMQQPPMQQNYGAPPMQHNVGAPPTQQPPMQQNYGAPPMQQNVGAPPMQQNVGAPPMQQNYGAPPTQQPPMQQQPMQNLPGRHDQYRASASASSSVPSGGSAPAKDPFVAIGQWGMGAIVVGALAVGGYFGWKRYQNQPDKVAQRAANSAAAKAKAGDIEEAIAAYDKVLTDFQKKASKKVLAKIGGELLTLHADQIPSPLTPENGAKAEQVVRRYERLIPEAQGSKTRAVIIARALKWTDELGTKTVQSMEAASSLLATTRKVASGGDASDIDKRLYKIKRTLAGKLAADWPVAAINLYMEVPGDAESLAKAGDLFTKLAVNSSLLLSAGEQAGRWITAARGHGNLSGKADAIKAALAKARRIAKHPARRRALKKGSERQLRAQLAKHPKDQRLVAALASARMRAGDDKGAVKLLAALGKPGWLIPQAQETLAEAHGRSGRLDQADKLLARIVLLGLPQYLSASRNYKAMSDAMYQRLLSQARAGKAPARVAMVLRGRDKKRAQKAFDDWVNKTMDSDPKLSKARQKRTVHSHVVSLSIRLGMIRLRRANGMAGAKKKSMLAQAERAFLAIRQDASGMPSYHLGLGQVYHRLGRAKDGDKELNGLLKRKVPWISLSVARTYRQLGMRSQAKKIAEEVYKTRKAPHHYQAASLRALMEYDLDKREMWLKRADQSSAYIQTTLIELRARKQFRAGNYRRADSTMSRAARRHEKGAKSNASDANNAALAYQFRYSCTGNKKYLARAVRLLEQAVQLAPDNSLIVSNLAGAHAHVGDLQVLSSVIKVDVLRMSQRDANAILADLKVGEAGPKLMAAAKTNVALNRSEVLLREQQVLSPKDTRGFSEAASRYALLDDEAKLLAMRDALRARKTAFEGSDPKVRAEYLSGKRDAKQLADAAREIKRAGRRIARAKRKRHKPTLAVALVKLGRDQMSRAYTSDDPAHTEQAIKTFRAAAKLWPALDTPDSIAWAMLRLAVQNAAAESPDVKKRWDKERRRYSVAMFFHHVLEDKDAASIVAALRKQPQIAEAAQMMVGPTTQADGRLLPIGRLANNQALQAKGKKGMAIPRRRHRVEINSRLWPSSDDAQAMQKLHAAHK